MEPEAPTALCLRTADKLQEHDVVRFPEMDSIETVLRVHTVDTGFVVRTRENIHHCRPDYLVEVVAVSIAGIGFVTPGAV